MAYRIEFDHEAAEHFGALTAGERAILVEAMEEQLVHQPTAETRNRKRMRPNPIAPWVLRVGHLRVYYEVKARPGAVVTVRAFGVKIRERVTIGGVEVDLS